MRTTGNMGRSNVTKIAKKRHARDLRLRRTYGLSIEQYDKMFQNQEGKCKICRRTTTYTLHVDHDHKGSKRVRGLLCFGCNHRLLGRGLENAEMHRRAADYLESDFDGRKI